MKRILFFAFMAMVFASCGTTKRVDELATEREVKPLATQVVEAILVDSVSYKSLTYKHHKDEILWVSSKGRGGWQIRAYNPDPILSEFGRFIRLRWMHADVAFVGKYKKVKLTDDEQQAIIEALKYFFDHLQKQEIEKNYPKYHQVKWLGDCNHVERAYAFEMPELHISFPVTQGRIFLIVSLEKL